MYWFHDNGTCRQSIQEFSRDELDKRLARRVVQKDSAGWEGGVVSFAFVTALKVLEKLMDVYWIHNPIK